MKCVDCKIEYHKVSPDPKRCEPCFLAKSNRKIDPKIDLPKTQEERRAEAVTKPELPSVTCARCKANAPVSVYTDKGNLCTACFVIQLRSEPVLCANCKAKTTREESAS